MDVSQKTLDMEQWTNLIEDSLEAGPGDAIVNLPDGVDGVYDAVFLGGGAAGRFGASYLKALGGRPLIIDRWPFLGGTCPHQACVPHHLFSDVAAELDLWRWFSGQHFFPEWDPSRASILQMVELFKAGRASAHAFMNWQTKEQLEVEYVLNASGTVLDAQTVEVAGLRFSTRNIVFGLGSRQRYLDIPGIDLRGVFDSATLVEDLDYEPTKCVVIGGSKVALIYSSFFQSTGCETTVVSRSPLMTSGSLRHVDDELRTYVVDGMRKRGINIIEGAAPVSVNGNGHVSSVTIQSFDGEVTELDADFFFLATGEIPNSEEAQEALGVAVDELGAIIVDKGMRTSVPGVYAAGDVIGPPMEMFKARKCGITASKNIMGQDATFDYSVYPDFLHTTYEVTWVGLSEREAREQHDNIITIRMPPEGIADGELPLPLAERTMLYAFSKPELSGFQKCVIDADSRRILGFHHVGYGAKDAFQYLDYLMHRPQGLTIDEMGDMNELFLNPEHFVQLCRLRAGRQNLVSL